MYRDMKGSTHVLASPEIAVVVTPGDERVSVPQAPDVWFRPLMLNTRQGQWCDLLRVRRSASKGGIAQLTKSLAIAYAGDGIRVNAIAPGWIATPLTGALQSSPERSQTILDRTPLKRWGQASDLVGGVLYLCSPAASFVTGAILVIDGGYAVS